jgi:hypothetical protein
MLYLFKVFAKLAAYEKVFCEGREFIIVQPVQMPY